MFHNILSNRGLLAGLVFFVIIVAGSLLYSWYVRREVSEDIARTQQIMQLREANKDFRAVQDIGVSGDTEALGPAETPLETDDGDAPISEETEALLVDDAGILDLADAFLSDEMIEEEPAEVPVSPFGFGPYPEVPIGFPENLMPAWTWSEDKRQRHDLSQLKDFELMHRVLVKLWNQGDRDFVGISGSNRTGKVYPTYPNTVYISIEEEVRPDGIIRKVRAKAGPGVPKIEPYLYRNGQMPMGVRVLDMDEHGINPYQFLGLE